VRIDGPDRARGRPAPEGDTIYQAARRLHQALAGRVLSVSDFRVPRYATVDLTGSTVLEVVPRGKHLVAGALTHPECEIGTVLLDQTVLAGLGNVYRIEVCFLGGVSPWTPVGELPDLAGLLERARRLIVANAERPTRVTTGSARPGEQLRIYGRGRRPCRRCGTAIRVAEQAPADAPEEARVTSWCPRCQPGPAPAGTRAGLGAAARGPRGRPRPGGPGMRT